MKEMQTLLEQLKDYNASDNYPFHMPGHKRRVEMGITSFPNPFSVDITEIDGFDNLHHAEGILKVSMEMAASVYGADKTYYLVNGSTCGILSAICGCAGFGSRILVGRNCHKSAYHGILLNHLEPVYLWPEVFGEGIQGGIAPEEVEEALAREKGISAVFITSPTYEGIVSDIKKIAEIVHRYEIPLVVDEAHGAHFPFGGEYFPASALREGADVVIQSLHKTLPSLTQTAVLHLKGNLVEPERIERYLRIFQSSSPSYVLLSSIDSCIRFMEREGRKLMGEYGERMEKWHKEAEKLKYLKLLSRDAVGRNQIADWDRSKIVVLTENTGLKGSELAERLRKDYGLESEMACCSYVILMTSLMDSEEGLFRLKEALFEIDKELEMKYAEVGRGERQEDGEIQAEEAKIWIQRPEPAMSIEKAEYAPAESIFLRTAPGRVSGQFITLYPPGIPALAPGEVFTAEAVAMIEAHLKEGFTVEGTYFEKQTGRWMVSVLEEKNMVFKIE